jgi:hypothetical protein
MIMDAVTRNKNVKKDKIPAEITMKTIVKFTCKMAV